MSYLSRLTERLGENQPDVSLTKLTKPSSVGFVSTPAGQFPALPPSIIMGLHRLTGPVPRVVADPSVWAEIVADAHRLRDEGWAAIAVALGWSALDLWGHGPEHDGLSVWLCSRRVTLLDAASAVVENGPDRRAQFTRDRGGMPGAKLLWELQ